MKSLIEFNTFVNEIGADNSRNYKIAVLEKYKNSDAIKYYLKFIYDPYIITGISDKKFTKPVKPELIDMRFDNLYEMLDWLKKNNTGTDKVISIIKYSIDHFISKKYYSSETEEPDSCIYWPFDTNKERYKALLRQIITKNLQLGVDTKTINKVMPGLIRVFSVQLSNKYFDKKDYVEGKHFAVTTKIDGMRCIAMKYQNKVSFWSRQGQEITGLVDLEEEMSRRFPNNIVLDGELVAIVDGPDTYKDTMKRARTKDAEKHGLKMLVFDYMSAEDFIRQDCGLDYIQRRNILDSLFACIYKNNGSDAIHYFELLPILYQGGDVSKITELLEEQTSKGEEGIMINILDAPYHFARTNDLLKAKKFNSCDLRVVGFEQGTNSNSNTLGALLLEYGNGVVKCGSGFSEEQRDEIWNNRSKYINTIVEISYFEETSNANGGLSLRFPTFKDFRPDKSEPNY